jgi:hypothetical protein
MSRLSHPKALISAATVVALAACSERPQPTGPTAVAGSARTATLPAACLKTDATALQQGISTLFAPSVRTAARGLEREVERACPSTGPVLNYVAAILEWRRQGLVLGTQPDGGNVALWGYLTRLFNYAGYALPNSAAALTKAGFIGLCDDTVDCELYSEQKNTGLAIYRGALAGTRVLVTGAPASCAPAAGQTNLKVWGQCVEVSVDPKKTPGDLGYTFAAPADASRPAPALVQTCFAEAVHHDPLVKYLYTPTGEGKPGKLAQLSGGSTRVSVRPAASPLPFFTANCDQAQAVDVAGLGTGEPSGFRGALTRLASSSPVRALSGVLSALGPKVAYAGHGGLGTLPGLIEATSLFGPVDPFVFQSTFTNDPLGTLKDSSTDDRGRGTWSVVTLNPGEVQVQSALGDPIQKFVVLNQQGGAAENKPGIQLMAQVAAQNGQTSFGSAGVYRIRWRSLVASSKAFGATFNVLDSQERAVASFAYANGTAAGSGPILFNGVPTGATWSQNGWAQYEITVDLDQKRVSFGVLGADPHTGPLVSGAAFANAAAANLAKAGWQFRSQNVQTIATDDFEILRLPDAVVTRR